MILHMLIAMVAGWLQQHQQRVITYLQEENRVLKAQLGGRRLRLTDTERRRLAALAHPLGRKRLQEVATLVTPETLLRWYKRLIAQKFDGSTHHRQLGRPRVAEEIEQLVIRMAAENAPWGYRRIQGALANLGHRIDKLTVRNILRRHHLEPAPQRRRGGMSWAQFLQLHWEVLAATAFFLAGRIIVPPAVVHALAVGRAQGVSLPDPTVLEWITVRPPASTAVLPLVMDLGPGETEGLALALESTDAIVILNDALARQMATTLAIRFRGSLGLLLDAKQAGLVAAITPLLDQLHALGFHLSAETRKLILDLASESL